MDLPRAIADSLITHALEEVPNECCGILAGTTARVIQHYRMTNVERSPYRYSMDGKEMLTVLKELDQNGWDLLAIYHSHTHSPAYPSDTDVRLATWPEAHYLLVSLERLDHPVLRDFRIVDGKITEEAIAFT